MKKVLFRIMSAVLSLALLLPCFCISGYASEKPTVSFLSDKTDNKLIISVYYENIKGLTGTGFQLYYDKSALTPDKITRNAEIWKNVIDDEKYIDAVNLNGNGVVKYNGAFLNDISDITDNTDKVHFIDIVFDITKGKETEINGKEIEFSAVLHFPGKKLPVEAKYIIDPATDPLLPEKRYAGDINNDGNVTAADARIILRYSVYLEDIPGEALPYGNLDFNNSISAADARLALRASVKLEELHSHYYEENSGSYLCLYCKKSFTLEKKHIHEYSYSDCFSTGKCNCGSDNRLIRGHIYSDSEPLCSVCGFNAGGIEAVYKDISRITAKISTSAENAEKGIAAGDNYAVIEAALYTVVYYEDIVELIKDFSELQKCRDEYSNACNILDSAVKKVTASSGDIYVTPENARALNEARIEAADKGKQAIILFDEVLAVNNLKK